MPRGKYNAARFAFQFLRGKKGNSSGKMGAKSFLKSFPKLKMHINLLLDVALPGARSTQGVLPKAKRSRGPNMKRIWYFGRNVKRETKNFKSRGTQTGGRKLPLSALKIKSQILK